jgi:Arf-GAP/coiled-coil/ANK repeat/PH domain-containing protein
MLKPLVLQTCHNDTPEFHTEVQNHEESVMAIEKQYKHILALMKEKQSIMERDRALSEQILKEFEVLATKHLEADSEESNSVQLILVAMRQTVDHQERRMDQLSKGVMASIEDYITNYSANLQDQKKKFWKSQADVYTLMDKLCQCRRHDMTAMEEVSVQLFDARNHYHEVACEYSSSLNGLQTKTRIEFLERLGDYMMSEYSYFHVSKITVQEVQPSVDKLYAVADDHRKRFRSVQQTQKEESAAIVKEVLLSRSRDLVAFHTHDLHQLGDTAVTDVSRHLHKCYPDLVYETQSLLPPVSVKAGRNLDKCGYLFLGELKAMGLSFSWRRHFFALKHELLVYQDPSGKRKHRTVVNLNLCTVKEYSHPNLERNFCFKVISPAKTLLLQAGSSQEVKSWIISLTDAIKTSLSSASYVPSSESTMKEPSLGAEGGLTTNKDKKPASKPTSTSIIKDLYAVQGNDYCVDCGAPKPKWASISLGVLICIECSGVHRSLGVAISKVRSLTLDTLNADALAKLKEIGNVRSNQIFEACLPEDFDKEAVRDPGARQWFIKEKYLTLKYVSDDDRARIKGERDRKLLEVLGSGTSSVQRTQSVLSNPNKGSSDSDEEVIIASTENPKKTVGKAKSPSTLTQ